MVWGTPHSIPKKTLLSTFIEDNDGENMEGLGAE